MQHYKYIFIDLDDTIWDFHTNARNSLEEMYIQRKLDKHFENFDEFFRIYAKRNIELWEAYGKGEITQEYLKAERFRYPLSKMGINDEELAGEIGHHYLEILPNQKELMPGALETLDYLYERYPLTLISNGFKETQHRKLKSAGIEHYFQHIVLSEEARALKPDPVIFEYAMQLNQAKPEECIMIGDSYASDIKGAMNAGIDQVYFPLAGIQNADQPATFCITQLCQLRNIL
jgi:YjjG family noncanonical pyrimidine nucleotidase